MSEAVVEEATTEEEVNVMRTRMYLEAVICTGAAQAALCDGKGMGVVAIVEDWPHGVIVWARHGKYPLRLQDAMCLAQKGCEIGCGGKVFNDLIGVNEINGCVWKRNWWDARFNDVQSQLFQWPGKLSRRLDADVELIPKLYNG